MSNDAIEFVPTETLKLPGLVCPMPVLRAKKALAKMTAGALLRVMSTDPHSKADLAEFCRQTGHVLKAQHEERVDDEMFYVSDIEHKA